MALAAPDPALAGGQGFEGSVWAHLLHSEK